MIHQTNRFHGRNSLRYVYQRGQVVRGAYWRLRAVGNSRSQTYRLAVVVSRKVSKSAVVRNRIRRRIYEVVRRYGSQIAGAYDLVFVVNSEAVATMSSVQLHEAVQESLQTAGVLRAQNSGPSDVHAIVKAKG